MPFQFSEPFSRRAHLLQNGSQGKGPVLYWMSREQRAEDSWPLLAAAHAAASLDRPLICLFCFAPSFAHAQKRHYAFLIQGLKETSRQLRKYNTQMKILYGEPGPTVAALTATLDAALVFIDFDPFPEKQPWRKEFLDRVSTTVYEVDGHNIIPAWIVSPKKEYSAATFRRKVHPLLDSYLEEYPLFPELSPRESIETPLFLSLEDAAARVATETAEAPLSPYSPGSSAARAAMRRFFSERLNDYDTRRNNPALSALSDLSPWLHFGQLSPQRVALEALKTPQSPAREAFLEELIVRRELADNFCFYEPMAGTYDGLPEWGRKTLALHAGDRRPRLYTMAELEEARTGDPLWNAAQKEMVWKGKMHGWARMYWAKKILEWTETPEEAFERVLILNDRYELDGRDPSGVVGVSWAIGGLHDRPWAERSVFGMVRYMNDKGAARKFRVADYIESVNAFISNRTGENLS